MHSYRALQYFGLLIFGKTCFLFAAQPLTKAKLLGQISEAMSRASSRTQSRGGSRPRGDRSSKDSSSLILSLGSASRSVSRTGSRGGLSRGGSRSRSRRAKRVPNSHVPVNFLLGNRGEGYFTEISNYPKVQQQHNGWDTAAANSWGFGPEVLISNGSYGGISIDGSNSIDNSNSSYVHEEDIGTSERGTYEPILDMALSRQERERMAAEVLLGRRSLLPQGSGVPPRSRNGWGSVFPMGSPSRSPSRGTPMASPLDWGSRPSTTKDSNYNKIVTFLFDPRYPKDDAPVAEKDFIVMNGLKSQLPTTRTSKKEAAEINKLRLINKSPESKVDMDVMETLLMVEESKDIGPLRLRKAR